MSDGPILQEYSGIMQDWKGSERSGCRETLLSDPDPFGLDRSLPQSGQKALPALIKSSDSSELHSSQDTSAEGKVAAAIGNK
jgi:hypothetical protein